MSEIQKPRETLYVKNISSSNITITDIQSIPVLKPKDRVDLLEYSTMEELNRSVVLRNYIDKEFLLSDGYLHTHDDKSYTTHNHDGVYSLVGHNHNSLYSVVSHNHDDLYSKLNHIHDDRYSLINHNHSGIYSLVDHNHSHNNLLNIDGGTFHLSENHYSILTTGKNADDLHTHSFPDVILNHNGLEGLQGGSFDEYNQYYYHLDEEEYDKTLLFLENFYFSEYGELIFDNSIDAENLNIDQWDIAYSWGNHASVGYLISSDLDDYWKSDGTSTATGNWNLSDKSITTTSSFISSVTYNVIGPGDVLNTVSIGPVSSSYHGETIGMFSIDSEFGIYEWYTVAASGSSGYKINADINNGIYSVLTIGIGESDLIYLGAAGPAVDPAAPLATDKYILTLGNDNANCKVYGRGIWYYEDNIKILFGSAGDSAIYFDGNNLVIDSQYDALGPFVDFVASDLYTTGAGIFGSLQVDNINIDGATISSSSGAISFDNEVVSTTLGFQSSYVTTDSLFSYLGGAIDVYNNLNLLSNLTQGVWTTSYNGATGNLEMSSSAGVGTTLYLPTGAIRCLGYYNPSGWARTGFFQAQWGSFNGNDIAAISGQLNSSTLTGSRSHNYYSTINQFYANHGSYNLTGDGIVLLNQAQFENADGTISSLALLRNNVSFSSGSIGTITNLYFLHNGEEIGTNNMTIVNAYGIYVENIDFATNNYAIKTGTGIHEFGDDVNLLGGLSLLDNEKIILGTGSDSEIYFDANNLIINALSEDIYIYANEKINLYQNTDVLIDFPVVDPGFDNPSDWTVNGGWSITGGYAVYTVASGVTTDIVLEPAVALTPVASTKYIVSFTVSDNTGVMYLEVKLGGTLSSTISNPSGDYSIIIETTDTTTLQFLGSSGKMGGSFKIDNVSIFQYGILTAGCVLKDGSELHTSLLLDDDGVYSIGDDTNRLKVLNIAGYPTSFSYSLTEYRGMKIKESTADIYIGNDCVYPGYYSQRSVVSDSIASDNSDDYTNIYQGEGGFQYLNFMWAIESNGSNGVLIGSGSITNPVPLTFQANNMNDDVSLIMSATNSTFTIDSTDCNYDLIFNAGTGEIIGQSDVVIDNTSSEAFLVRLDSDGGDVFLVDTVSGYVGVNKTPSVELDVNGDVDATTIYAPEIYLNRSDTYFDYNAGDIDIYTPANKTIELQTSVWDDIQFNVEAGRTSAVNFPDWDTSFSTNTGAYKFDVDDYIDLGTNEMFHWWKEGTVIKPHVHIALDGANASGSSQYAKFILYIAYADENSVYTETNATGEIEIPNGTADLTHLFLTLTDVDFAGLTIGTQVNVRLKRIAATTGTEYSNHVFVTQVGIHAEKDTLGSRNIGTK